MLPTLAARDDHEQALLREEKHTVLLVPKAAVLAHDGLAAIAVPLRELARSQAHLRGQTTLTHLCVASSEQPQSQSSPFS